MICSALAFIGALWLSSCASPDPVTEILVSMDTDMVRRGDVSPTPALSLIRLELLVPGEPPRTGFTAIVLEEYRERVDPPVSWGVWDVDDPLEQIEIVVTGVGEDVEPIVEKRARLGFVRNDVRLLCLDLMSACVGFECLGDTTCHVGEMGVAACVPIDIDVSRLPIYRGDETDCLADWPDW